MGLQTQFSTDARLKPWNVSGEEGPGNCVIRPKMTASDDTPRSGESVSEDSAINWEQLGRLLLAGELERQGFELRDQYLALARMVKEGDEIGAEEMAMLYSSDRKVLLKQLEGSMDQEVTDQS
jgi:hypothetical protein